MRYFRQSERAVYSVRGLVLDQTPHTGQREYKKVCLLWAVNFFFFLVGCCASASFDIRAPNKQRHVLLFFSFFLFFFLFFYFLYH